MTPNDAAPEGAAAEREAAWKERLKDIANYPDGRISLDAEMHERIKSEFVAGWEARAARTEATKAEPVEAMIAARWPQFRNEGETEREYGRRCFDLGRECAAPPSADSVRQEALEKAARLCEDRASRYSHPAEVGAVAARNLAVDIRRIQPASTESAEPKRNAPIVFDEWTPEAKDAFRACCSQLFDWLATPASPAEQEALRADERMAVLGDRYAPAEQASPPDDAVRLPRRPGIGGRGQFSEADLGDIEQWGDEYATAAVLADRRSRAETPTPAKAVDYLKTIYDWIDSTCPAGSADEAFRMVDAATRDQIGLPNARSSDDDEQRAVLGEQIARVEGAALNARAESQVPEGWQLVPKLIHPAMCQAFYECTLGDAAARYDAMLAAAPKGPSE